MAHAVVDLGSNSFHLLIVSADYRQQLLRLHHKTHIAQGLKIHGVISEDAIQRAVVCLTEYYHYLQRYCVTDVITVATEAFRQARNGDKVLALARKALSSDAISVLSGEQEAYYTYLGVQRTIDSQAHVLVIDIGGGSSELIVGQAKKIIAMKSISFGVVSIAETFFAGRCFSIADYRVCKAQLQPQIASLVEGVRLAVLPTVAVYGTSGAIGCLEPLGRQLGCALENRYITKTYLQKITVAWDTKPFSDITCDDLPVALNNLIPAGMLLLELYIDLLALRGVQICAATLSDGLLMHPSTS